MKGSTLSLYSLPLPTPKSVQREKLVGHTNTKTEHEAAMAYTSMKPVNEWALLSLYSPYPCPPQKAVQLAGRSYEHTDGTRSCYTAYTSMEPVNEWALLSSSYPCPPQKAVQLAGLEYEHRQNMRLLRHTLA